MNGTNKGIVELLKKYGADTKEILRKHTGLEYLYALSVMRENLLEWYPFRAEGSLLEVGSDYGALTGLYSRKVNEVVVLEESLDSLEAGRIRHGEVDNVLYVEASLEGYARNQESTKGKRFDYVMMIGSLEPDCEPQIAAAKALLKPGGELILAVCNPFGIKYWAGAERDSVSFSKKGITRLLGGGRGELEFYYPMPDYKLPITIYSQSYLPAKGDWTNTLTAYDYPEYMLLDVDAAYDAVCEDGQFEQFANSFLTIWRNYGSD